MTNRDVDVVVLGEVLVELSADVPLRRARHFSLSFSGDALNSAAAARAAGAEVALVTRVGNDELGESLVEHIERLGVGTAFVLKVDAPNGVYFMSVDPAGEREFIYARRQSAGSTLSPADLEAVVGRARGALGGGIACAISTSSAQAVEAAARAMRDARAVFVYDPNFRARLTTPAKALKALERLAPYAAVVTPSCPGDGVALFGTDDPGLIAKQCLDLGAGAVAVTCGRDGVLLETPSSQTHLPAMTTPAVIDATGAGDAFAGAMTARLVLGDELEDAARLGMAAAQRSLGAPGGTGWLGFEHQVDGETRAR